MPDRRVVLFVRLPEECHRRLKMMAVREGRSMQQLAEQVLTALVEADEKDRATA